MVKVQLVEFLNRIRIPSETRYHRLSLQTEQAVDLKIAPGFHSHSYTSTSLGWVVHYSSLVSVCHSRLSKEVNIWAISSSLLLLPMVLFGSHVLCRLFRTSNDADLHKGHTSTSVHAQKHDAHPLTDIKLNSRNTVNIPCHILS